MRPATASRPALQPAWFVVAAVGLAAIGFALQGGRDDQPQTRVIGRPMPLAGGTSDSNNRMIAVTGLDVTGQSVLYVVDTVGMHIAVYQASGGGPSTQGLKLVGARNIALDLELDGFNDKTEEQGKPLGYKDLEQRFRASGLLPQDE